MLYSYVHIGDFKFLFMVLGRDGYSSNHCLYCKLTRAQWKVTHEESKSINCNAPPWTIEGLTRNYLGATQPDSVDDNFVLQGQKSIPIWSFIPIRNVLIPVLHIVLGLGNDLVSNFFEWVDERIEIMTEEECNARYMCLLAEIALDNSKREKDDCINRLADKIHDRKNINEELKDKNIDLAIKENLLSYKSVILEEENELRLTRDVLQKKVTNLRQTFNATKKVESEIRGMRGKKEKAIRNSILDRLGSLYGITMSSYHGGDMEGPSIRKLMAKGRDVFQNILTFLTTTVERSENFKATDDEIRTTCNDFGEILVLLDGAISMVNTKRGKVSDELIRNLADRLQCILCEWNRLNFSITPKLHVLLNHSISQLKETNGFADMGEDVLERAHQARMKHEKRLLRLRYKAKKMSTQAKTQDIDHIKKVQEIQQKVTSSRKRNLTRDVALKVERDSIKKQLKEEERNTVWDLKTNRNDEPIRLNPREVLKEQIRLDLSTTDNN